MILTKVIEIRILLYCLSFLRKEKTVTTFLCQRNLGKRKGDFKQCWSRNNKTFHKEMTDSDLEELARKFDW